MKHFTIPNAVIRSEGMPANAVQVMASEGSLIGPVDRVGDIVDAACRLHLICLTRLFGD